jgi:hypothetical protein
MKYIPAGRRYLGDARLIVDGKSQDFIRRYFTDNPSALGLVKSFDNVKALHIISLQSILDGNSQSAAGRIVGRTPCSVKCSALKLIWRCDAILHPKHWADPYDFPKSIQTVLAYYYPYTDEAKFRRELSTIDGMKSLMSSSGMGKHGASIIVCAMGIDPPDRPRGREAAWVAAVPFRHVVRE